MYIPPLEYVAPATIAEALAALAQTTGVVPLAGGTDLVVMMKEGRAAPPGLVSLRRLSELKELTIQGDKCTLGAGVTVTQIERSELSTLNPGFADMVRNMASPPIRNRATVGGNLCTAAACADIPPILMVNDAVVTIVGSTGERNVPLVDFFTGPRQTQLKSDELLARVSCRATNRGTSYIKFGPRKVVNIAIVGVACALELEGGNVSSLKIAVTAASPTPILLNTEELQARGATADAELWERVAGVALKRLAPISDIRASAEYRRELAQVGVIRACERALARLNGDANA
jgi:CO/xanthine dehydrogenase FAD-binding subunit